MLQPASSNSISVAPQVLAMKVLAAADMQQLVRTRVAAAAAETTGAVVLGGLAVSRAELLQV